MSTDDEIADLKVRRQAVIDELEAAISEHAPESRKQALADRLKQLTDELTKLGHEKTP